MNEQDDKRDHSLASYSMKWHHCICTVELHKVDIDIRASVGLGFGQCRIHRKMAAHGTWLVAPPQNRPSLQV